MCSSDLTEDLNQVSSLQRAIVLHEVNGLTGTFHNGSVLNRKRTTDSADNAFQVGVSVEAEAPVIVQVPAVVVILFLGKQARKVSQDIFFQAGNAFRDQQAGGSVSIHDIHYAILDSAFADSLFNARRDVYGLFRLPRLNFDSFQLDDHFAFRLLECARAGSGRRDKRASALVRMIFVRQPSVRPRAFTA